MLEQQQSQLVAGLQETYHRLLASDIWPGDALPETNGRPLTHDILARLNLLEQKHDGSGEHEIFEEDCQKLQQRLVSEGASLVARRGSVSSESEHGYPSKHARKSSRSSFHSTPTSTHAAPVLDENFSFKTSPSPVSQSPAPKLAQLRSPIKPSPLHNETISNDAFLMPSWQEQLGLHGMTANDAMRSQMAIQTPAIHDGFQNALGYGANAFEPAMDFDNMMSFGNPTYGNPSQGFGSFGAQDWTNEPMDVDFSKFVQFFRQASPYIEGHRGRTFVIVVPGEVMMANDRKLGTYTTFSILYARSDATDAVDVPCLFTGHIT